MLDMTRQPGSHSRLELHLLGPPRLTLDGIEVKLVLKKVLGLMAYLALEGATSRARVVGLFWSNLDEDSARRNLRRELHRLKTKAAKFEGQIETVEDWLHLAQPVPTDVHDFLAAIEREDLEEALRLYSGSLLEGFELDGANGFHEWLEVKRNHLEREHTRAMRNFAERLETRGDWRRALGLHLRLLERDPLQERTHRSAIRLHYLLDEREAALEQFERLEHVLSTELGLAPLPETVQLLEQIRSMQTIAPFHPTTTTERVQLRVPLLGRDVESKQLTAAQGAVLVIGEPGVGKTRLLSEVFHASNAVWLRFTQASNRTPLSAVAQAVRHAYRTEAGRARLEALENHVRLETARLVPELEPDIRLEPRSGEEARDRFLEGIGRTLLALGDVLIVEDTHWADPSSLEVVRWLARAAKVRLVMSARPAELEANEAAFDLTRQLEWAQKLERIDLAPLQASDVRELVLLNAPAADEGFIKRLTDTARGNPFFVLETLRYVLERPDTRETLPVPPTVREAVLERVKRLGNAAWRLLEVASLTDDGFSLPGLAPATALTDFEAVSALEQAVNTQILSRLESGFGFAHTLVQQAIADSISAERRTLIHNKLADALAGLDAAPTRVAHHLEMAGRVKDAVRWRIQAGQLAVRVYANTEALEHYQKALENSTHDQQTFELRLLRTDLWERLGDVPRWAEELEQLNALARQIGSAQADTEVILARAWFMLFNGSMNETIALLEPLLTRAGLSDEHLVKAGHLIGSALLMNGKPLEAEPHLRASLERLPPQPSAVRAGLESRLAACIMERGDYSQAIALHESAKQGFAAINHREGAASEVINQSWARALSGDVAGSIPGFEHGLNEMKAVGSVGGQITALINLGHYLSLLLRFEEARARLEQGLALARNSGNMHRAGTLLLNLAEQYRFQGQLGQAFRALQEAIAIVDERGIALRQAIYRLDMADFLLELGSFDDARTALDAARAIIETGGLERHMNDLQCLQAQLDISTGKPGLAAAWAETRLKSALTADETDVVAWVASMAWLACDQCAEALDAIARISSDEPMTQAVKHTVRLNARVALGTVQPDELELPSRLLSEVLKPGIELDLRHALVRASTWLNTPDRQEWRETSQARLLEMAATLEQHPDLKRLFLNKYSDLLEV